MAASAEVAAQQPVPAQVVGNAFVHQYYLIQHQSPGLVHRFYHDISKLGRPEEDGSMNITTTLQAINEKIVALNYGELRAEIKSVDAQESFDGGVHLLVTGYLTGKENKVRNFTQTFFLAPQEKGYFVLNDMFRYVDSVSLNPALVSDVVVPISEEPVAPLVEENHVSEQSTPTAEESITAEVYNPPENGEIPVAEEEEFVEQVPVPEVVDEVLDDKQIIIETSTKMEEVPKRSYASIVRHLKESGATMAPPAVAPRKAPPKNIEQVNPTFSAASDRHVTSLESVDNGNNQDGEAEGHSIYIKGLPMNATESLLDEVFKNFGTIKKDGIQVRSKQQGFCFGFVEFEEASSVQNALEASPVLIGGCQAVVEEKRSTNSRGNRVRSQSARDSGIRSEGVRERGGNYGGGRGYGRDDFNGRKFGNRSDDSRNGDGYNRAENVDSNGRGRVYRNGGVANGRSKNTIPRVSATA